MVERGRDGGTAKTVVVVGGKMLVGYSGSPLPLRRLLCCGVWLVVAVLTTAGKRGWVNNRDCDCVEATG